MSSSIIALVNAKGGSGATTITVDLARQMRRTGSVAVVDADLSGRRNMAVILDAVRQLDSERTSSAFSVVQTGGLTVVELTDTLDNSFLLRPDEIEQLLEALSHHDFILIDVPVPFAAAVRPFIAQTSRFLVVLEPNLLGTAAARTLVGDMARFGIPMSRLSILTNLRSGRPEIGHRELERALGAPIVGEVPAKSDRNFPRAVEAIAKRLAAIAPEPVLENLRPSSAPSSTSSSADRRSSAMQNGSPSSPMIVAGAGPLAPRDKLKLEVHEQLSKKIDFLAASRAHTDSQKAAELRAQISELAAQIISEHTEVGSAEESARIRQEIIDEVLGYGPLEDLMRDSTVTEVMVNGPSNIYVERGGLLMLTNKRFLDERQLRLVIERIIAPLGRRVDESSPMVDARLPDGSRVNAIIEPIALNGATLTIRRFGTRRLDIDDLVRLGAITAECVELLRAMVQAHLNIVVSGGTGSGKTTFLNILSGFIPNTERIITIEDAAELMLKQEHVVRLESRPPNLEGLGAISIRDLVRNALRMRPDRIVVGEVRSGEALDMLQAMNTGHDGSLTTLHANAPRDAISRLETLVMMAGFDLPVKAIREQIAGAVDVIVQTSRMRDGSRKVTSITEVVGMEGDTVTMQEIVKFQQRGLDVDHRVVGEFQFTGVQPQFAGRFEELGVDFDLRELARMPVATNGLW